MLRVRPLISAQVLRRHYIPMGLPELAERYTWLSSALLYTLNGAAAHLTTAPFTGRFGTPILVINSQTSSDQTLTTYTVHRR